MKPIFHALVLNLHQPSGNLDHLLDNNEWGAREILFALDRIPRSLWRDEDCARVHLSMSGTLLETLTSEDFQRRVYGIIDCGSFLWHLQNEKIFQILGTAYYHPVLPLIPEADQEEHLSRWLGIGSHVFWRKQFSGFWPPELSFSMALIPLIKRMGYQFVIVDSDNVEAMTPMSREELYYQPHIARYGDDEIIVIVRDRELSEAQESGMTYSWFRDELEKRTRGCDFIPLVTTGTDGDNGGWFRNTAVEENFWGGFYQELLHETRKGDAPIRPVFINDYLKDFPARGEVRIRTAPWNTNWHHGQGFVQWTGSQKQKEGFARVAEISNRVHYAMAQAGKMGQLRPEVSFELENALWHILRAETSCNFYWGDEWVDRCLTDLDAAKGALHRAEAMIPPLKQRANQKNQAS